MYLQNVHRHIHIQYFLSLLPRSKMHFYNFLILHLLFIKKKVQINVTIGLEKYFTFYRKKMLSNKQNIFHTFVFNNLLLGNVRGDKLLTQLLYLKTELTTSFIVYKCI